MKYSKHIFICTNQRPKGSRICCGEQRGLELVTAFKKAIKDQGLQVEIRTQRTGCLETCELGPALVVYPKGIFYGKVTLNDVNEIVEAHLKNNTVVERLRMDLELLKTLQK